jgi:NAD(P)-dependent dehydrogenase (short-subunit alcohol dehydrogenase family)
LSRPKRNPPATSKNTIASFAGAPAASSPRLEGRSAIVTGAGSGIGAAIARRFAAEGARLVLNDINRSGVESVASALRQAGADVAVVAGDVSREEVAKRLVASAVRHFASLQILVNSAGIAGSAAGDGPVTSSSLTCWNKVLRINLGSVYLCCRHAIPAMIEGGYGSIVNLSSVLALSGSADFFTSHAYVASKGAIVSLTRAIAAHYAGHKIRANVICPGLIATPMTARAGSRKDLMTYVAGKQRLLGGFGSPEGVADAVLFLASDESRLMTGVVFPVDGGWSAGY